MRSKERKQNKMGMGLKLDPQKRNRRENIKGQEEEKRREKTWKNVECARQNQCMRMRNTQNVRCDATAETGDRHPRGREKKRAPSYQFQYDPPRSSRHLFSHLSLSQELHPPPLNATSLFLCLMKDTINF